MCGGGGNNAHVGAQFPLPPLPPFPLRGELYPPNVITAPLSLSFVLLDAFILIPHLIHTTVVLCRCVYGPGGHHQKRLLCLKSFVNTDVFILGPHFLHTIMQVLTDLEDIHQEPACSLFLRTVVQVLTDLEDIHQVPVYFVDGVSFTDAPSQVYEGVERGQGCTCPPPPPPPQGGVPRCAWPP